MRTQRNAEFFVALHAPSPRVTQRSGTYLEVWVLKNSFVVSSRVLDTFFLHFVSKKHSN